jgi:hypothetical protein
MRYAHRDPTPHQAVQGWLCFPSSSLTSLFRRACQRCVLRRRPMRNVPIDLQRSQHLLQDADRLLAVAAALCAHSRALIARGKTRAVARACAAVTSEAPPAREGGMMAPHSRQLRQRSLLVVCAWCTKRLRWQYMQDMVALYTTSHSICPPCREKVLRELGERAPR